MTTYAVVGAGAIGGFYGGRLVQAGQEVHFLFRDRAAAVKAEGLEIISPNGDVVLEEVLAYESADEMPQVDVVIVAVKALVNADVAPIVGRLVKSGGAVLLIQNGVNGEEVFRHAVPDSVEILGGLAFISSQVTGPRQVTHFDHGLLTVGRYQTDYLASPATQRMRDIEAELESVGVDVDLVDDLLLARWQKLLWNLPFNGISVVLDALTDEMVADENVAMITGLMGEVIEAAAADGRTIDPEFIELLIAGTKIMTPYSTSMKVDANKGRRLEVEAMIGNPLRRAQAHGLAVPRMELLYQQVKFCDNRIASSASAQDA